jgi:hypothetical protein
MYLRIKSGQHNVNMIWTKCACVRQRVFRMVMNGHVVRAFSENGPVCEHGSNSNAGLSMECMECIQYIAK